MVFRLGLNRGYLARKQRGPYIANRMPFHAPIGVVSPAFLGYVNDYPTWNHLFELYLQDELSPAFEMAEQAGVGQTAEYLPFLQVLEAESDPDGRNEIVRIDDSTEVEMDAEALHRDARLEAIATELRGVIPRLPNPGSPLLISFLAEGAELPSLAFMEGFYVHKKPYGKLCVTAETAGDPARLGRHIRRGYAYHVASGLTNDTCDAWVLEGATTLAHDEPMRTAKPLELDEVDGLLEGASTEETPELIEDARALAQGQGVRLFAKNPGRLAEFCKAHATQSIGDAWLASKERPTERAMRHFR